MKSIHVVEDLLPLAWERAVIACWEQGESFPTEYDRPGDPNSRDVTALIHVKRPFDEPRIHRNFPGGLEDLEKYRSEVLYGVHDHWIDPAAGKWEYTYHERLFEYRVGERVFDQIDAVVRKLKAVPHTRRAQAVTWQVWNDLEIDDPACLQRMWFRISGGKLHLNVHFRSNDAFKAAFMNIYAFTELQREVAAKVGVEPGEYIHLADSFHIYGSYFHDVQGFVRNTLPKDLKGKTFDPELAKELFIEGCDLLLNEADMPEAKRARVLERRRSLVDH